MQEAILTNVIHFAPIGILALLLIMVLILVANLQMCIRDRYMEIEYRRTWNQSVMLITGHVEEENYELKMLKHNTVAGLLPVEEIQETGDFRFCYDITGKKSLECYLENNALNPVMIKKILENLIHLCREMERYLLKEEKLLLKEDMIFMDSREEQFYFCYYPDKEGELREEFGKLIEEMLPQFCLLYKSRCV